jgi:phospholipid/cholesterol/gamma-HCH transport system substrate-binding protein
MKRRQMHQSSMEVTVGAFMFMVLLALGFFTIVLSRENIMARNYRYDVAFDDVSGLIKGDKVYVHGVDIGRVRTMNIEPGGVRIGLSLREALSVHEDYKVSIQSSSMLGGRYVALDPGTASRPVLPEGSQLKGAPTVDLIHEATEAVTAVRNSLEQGGVLTNLQATMENVRQLTDDLAQGKGTIGRLLKDEEVYNELKQVSTNLRNLTDKLDRGEGTLGKLIKDDAVYADVKQITSDLRQVSDNLAKGEGTLGKLLSKDDQLYRDLSDSAASIKNITASIDKGEGTLGKLTRDDRLYQDLSKTVGEVRAMVDDLRETSPVVSFSSVFFGAF